jgi:probable HAF family extracellular repeat protein
MNRPQSRAGSCSGVVLVALLLAASAFAAPPMYSVTDLGVLGTPVINSRGVVGGLRTTNSGATFDLMIYSNGVTAYLGTLPGSPINAFVQSINSSGQLVGYDSFLAAAPGLFHGFLWDGSTLSEMGTLGGTNCEAYGINDSGQVAGFSETAAGTNHAFLFSNGTMNDLGVLARGTVSMGFGLNNAGQVVGSASTVGQEFFNAFLYKDGTMNGLGTLGGGRCEAHGINDSGQIIGWGTSRSSGYTHGFLYSNGAMMDLGTLPGCVYSQANAINNSGLIAGYSATDSFAYRAFLYTGGTMTDLNSLIDASLGWTLWMANSINDQGQIVGNGQTASGQVHAFLLTPTIVLQISPAPPNAVQIQFTAQANMGYVVEYRDSLSSGSWQLFVVLDPITIMHEVSLTDPLVPGRSARFYRVRAG